MFLLGWVKKLQSSSSKAHAAWGSLSKTSGHSNQVWKWENNPLIHRDVEMRSELVLGCWVWCTRGFGVVHPGTVSSRREPMLENGKASQEMIPVTHTIDRHWDKGVPALTVKDKRLHPRFPLSHISSSQPALTGMVFVKRNVLLPSIQLHWKKPAHGSDVFHNVNLADTRTTAIWASQLILLCSLPEQTFTRQGELEGRMKNKPKQNTKNLPQLKANKTGMQNTTLQEKKYHYCVLSLALQRLYKWNCC